jgi:hypothetical protein
MSVLTYSLLIILLVNLSKYSRQNMKKFSNFLICIVQNLEILYFQDNWIYSSFQEVKQRIGFLRILWINF